MLYCWAWWDVWECIIILLSSQSSINAHGEGQRRGQEMAGAWVLLGCRVPPHSLFHLIFPPALCCSYHHLQFTNWEMNPRQVITCCQRQESNPCWHLLVGASLKMLINDFNGNQFCSTLKFPKCFQIPNLLCDREEIIMPIFTKEPILVQVFKVWNLGWQPWAPAFW